MDTLYYINHSFLKVHYLPTNFFRRELVKKALKLPVFLKKTEKLKKL